MFGCVPRPGQFSRFAQRFRFKVAIAALQDQRAMAEDLRGDGNRDARAEELGGAVVS